MNELALERAPRRPSSSADALLEGAPHLAGTLSGIGVLAIFAVVMFEIVARYLFSSPTSWSVEISIYLVIAVAYLGAAYAHKLNANVRVTLLLDALPQKARLRLQEAAAWSSLFFVMIATWQIFHFIHANYVNGTMSYILVVPQWIPNIPILLGFVLLSLAILNELQSLRTPPSRWQEWGVIALVLATPFALFIFRANGPLLGQLSLGFVLTAAAVVASIFMWSNWKTLAATLAICAGIGAALAFAKGLAVGYSAALLFSVVLVSFLAGVRIAFGLGLVALMALHLLLPFPLPGTIAERAFTSLESFSLTALPMFVLMGSLLVRSGIATELFETLMKWMGRFPGGIAHASVGACSIFAAVSGSSIATAATIGSVACPEMVKHGYSRRLAYGSVAAGGTLGILIPPSVPLIIYGTLAGVSVSKLFVAAVLPGLILTVLFMAAILVWATVAPQAVPAAGSFTWRERLSSLRGTAPFALLIFCVLGSLYLGIVTPTEAGAVGAFMAAALCIARRRFGLSMMWSSVLETVVVTGFILLIVFNAALLTFIIDYLRVSQLLLSSIAEFDVAPIAIFLVICAFYIVLGMFLDSISLITLSLPVVFPLIVSLGFDPVWFGIVLVILVEIGLITPPVGLNLFVLQGLGKVPLKDVALGALPFAIIMVAFVVVLYAFPDTVTWLPEHVR